MDKIADWVVDVVDALGYSGVALLVALENVFPPIPSEVVLASAGFVASRGDATVWGMIVAATAGSVIGAWILYGVAAAIGPAGTRAFVRRYGRWLRITEKDLDRGEAFFDRWSTIAVLFCRCIPLVRSIISVPAGLRRMPLVRFTLLTAIGSIAWNSVFVIAGFYLGERWEDVVHQADILQYVVLGVLAVLVLYLAYRWWKRRPGRMAARIEPNAAALRNPTPEDGTD